MHGHTYTYMYIRNIPALSHSAAVALVCWRLHLFVLLIFSYYFFYSIEFIRSSTVCLTQVIFAKSFSSMCQQTAFVLGKKKIYMYVCIICFFTIFLHTYNIYFSQKLQGVFYCFHYEQWFASSNMKLFLFAIFLSQIWLICFHILHDIWLS